MRPDISMGEAVRLVITEEVGNFRQLVGVWPVPVPEQKKESAIPGKKCKNCGDDSLGNDKSYEVRREKCPAFREKCKKCAWLGHYPKQCHLFPALKDTKDQEEKAERLEEYGLLDVTRLCTGIFGSSTKETGHAQCQMFPRLSAGQLSRANRKSNKSY